MNVLFAMIIQEYKVLFKDKQSLAVLFLMPVVLIFFLSLALTDIYKQKVGEKIKISVFSEESTLNTQIIDKFASFTYIIDPVKSSPLSFEDYLENANPMIAIRIPSSMAEIIKNNSDSADKITFYFSSKLDHSIREMIKSHFMISVQSVVIGQVNHRIESMQKDNDALKGLSINTLDASDSFIEEVSSLGRIPTPIEQTVPAWTLFAMFFIIIPLSSSFIRDRDAGVLSRLRGMGLSKSKILVSRIVSYLFINNIQFFLMFIIGMFVVPQLIGENFTLPRLNFEIVITTFICSLTATSYGLCVTAFARTNEQANTLGALSIMIMALLGGVMIPHFIMPDFMQSLSVISPLYWGLETYLNIFLENFSVIQLLPNLAVLVGFSIFFFVLSLKKFNWEH